MLLCHADLPVLRGPAAVRRVGWSCSAGSTLCLRNNWFSWWNDEGRFGLMLLPPFYYGSSCTKDEKNISNWSEKSVKKLWIEEEDEVEKSFLWNQRRFSWTWFHSDNQVQSQCSIGGAAITNVPTVSTVSGFYSFDFFFVFDTVIHDRLLAS